MCFIRAIRVGARNTKAFQGQLPRTASACFGMLLHVYVVTKLVVSTLRSENELWGDVVDVVRGSGDLVKGPASDMMRASCHLVLYVASPP